VVAVTKELFAATRRMNRAANIFVIFIF